MPPKSYKAAATLAKHNRNNALSISSCQAMSSAPHGTSDMNELETPIGSVRTKSAKWIS